MRRVLLACVVASTVFAAIAAEPVAAAPVDDPFESAPIDQPPKPPPTPKPAPAPTAAPPPRQQQAAPVAAVPQAAPAQPSQPALAVPPSVPLAPGTIHRNVSSGLSMRVAQSFWFDQFCTALPMEIIITQQPQNGTITIRDGSAVIQPKVQVGSVGSCAGRPVSSKDIFYQSRTGFSGEDHFEYRSVSVRGNAMTKSIEVSVR